MGNYLLSDRITVFPSMNRSVNPRSARSFNEYNLTHLVNQLTDTDSFVISNELDSTHPEFEFNIAGYYFKVDSYLDILEKFEDVVIEAGNNIYAEIVLNTNQESFNFNELEGYDVLDNDNKIYNGVDFKKATLAEDVILKEEDAEAHILIYRLPLFTCRSANNNILWDIESSSKIKFSSASIQIIDGGID